MDQERGYRTEGQESEGGVSNLVYTGNCREGFVRGLLVTRGVYIQWIRVEDWQEELLSLEFLGLESDEEGGNSAVLVVGSRKAMNMSLMVKYKIHKKSRGATGKLTKIPLKWRVRTKKKARCPVRSTSWYHCCH